MEVENSNAFILAMLSMEVSLEPSYRSLATRAAPNAPIMPAISGRTALQPDILQDVVMQIGTAAKKFHELAQDPIILTSQVIRVYVYRMLEQFYPSVYVLSFHEITNNVQIQAIGSISVSKK